jgi:uncharacterized protein YdaU (DUF1376 family)
MLLDVYYTSELPLPTDVKATARKAGARSKEEIAAVETILSEFFELTNDGWIQVRCAEEIAVYQSKSGINKVVGKRGGRPKKITQTVSDGNPEITQTVSDGNPEITQTVSENCDYGNPNVTLNTNHKPLTNNQYPLTPVQPDGFDVLYEAYPKKVGKPAARKAFNAAKINGNLEYVLRDIERRKQSPDWLKNKGQFIPNPATYLNQRRWEDVVETGSEFPDWGVVV